MQACDTTLTCPGSSSCSLLCSDDCTLCIARCGNSLKHAEKTPWLLRAETIRFAGNNLERTYLAEYLSLLLDTKISRATDNAEPVTVSDFKGTMKELLDHVELRAERYPEG